MNENVKKNLLTGDKFMPELHLRQTGFTYSACRPFPEHRQRIQTFKETGNLSYIFKNELDKAYFAQYAEYGDGKDIGKKTISNKILKDYEISINPKDDGYQRRLRSMVYKFFDKKTGSRTNKNEVLVQELNKPSIKKFERRKMYARFKVNVWATD